jgi:cell division septum initiation protein DivIVA
MNEEVTEDYENKIKENKMLKEELNTSKAEVERLRSALELIAAPKRPDGTYNRCREACETLASKALNPSAK